MRIFRLEFLGACERAQNDAEYKKNFSHSCLVWAGWFLIRKWGHVSLSVECHLLETTTFRYEFLCSGGRSGNESQHKKNGARTCVFVNCQDENQKKNWNDEKQNCQDANLWAQKLTILLAAKSSLRAALCCELPAPQQAQISDGSFNAASRSSSP